MKEFQCFLEKWQTLIGSILGGLIALFAALIVANSMRRRDEVASAMLVVGNLAEVRNVADVLDNLAKEDKISEQDYPLWLSEKLVHSHPSLSALFEASLVRLMPVDKYMAAHLTLFHLIYSKTKIILDRLSKDFDHFHKHGKPIRSQDYMRADARIVTQHFKQAVCLASCAEYFISQLVLSNLSLFHRLRRYLYMTQKEKDCLRLLNEGNS